MDMEIKVRPNGRDDGFSSVYIKRSDTVETYLGAVSTRPDGFNMYWVSVGFSNGAEVRNLTVAVAADELEGTLMTLARLELRAS